MGNSCWMAESEEAAFPSERVEGIVGKHIENTITEAYDDAKVDHWILTITEKVMGDLVELNKPFKFIGEPSCNHFAKKWTFAVNCVIMEQTKGGINTANSAYWNSVRDGCKVVVWP